MKIIDGDELLKTIKQAGLKSKDPNIMVLCGFVAGFVKEAPEVTETNPKMIPQEIDVEGGGFNWWCVCPECRGIVDCTDHFCKHCGQALRATIAK